MARKALLREDIRRETREPASETKTKTHPAMLALVRAWDSLAERRGSESIYQPVMLPANYSGIDQRGQEGHTGLPDEAS